MTMQWGILGPGTVESTRRVRTLGLAASTRLFNDLAVPGLGGVWFGRQLFLATLGVLVAERVEARGRRISKIAVSNAIEALACWLALKGTKAGDGRIRGSVKLAGVGRDELLFGNVSRPSFYVTQPMRMATVTALPALGLVEAAGSRFNSFSCNPEGLAFVEAVTQGHRPCNHELVEHLVLWVLGEDDRVHTSPLRQALSPLEPLPADARVLLEESLHQGASESPACERQRRSEALDWVRSRRWGAPPSSWDQQPRQISDPGHWADLRAGAAFFSARDAALEALNEMERLIGSPECRHTLGTPLPRPLIDRLALLRNRARAFLDLHHADQEAAADFCREVLTPENDEVLRRLLRRDGRILRLVGEQVCPGSAFHGGQSSEEAPAPEMEEGPPSDDTAGYPDWPADISYRIRNLWWLSLDLDGELESWLHPDAAEANHG